MINNSKIVNILGTTYTIEYVDKIEVLDKNTWKFGECNSANHHIKIATKFYNGLPIDNKELQKNLLHEIIYAILVEGQFFDESFNEPLVEWIARCIHDILKQNII